MSEVGWDTLDSTLRVHKPHPMLISSPLALNKEGLSGDWEIFQLYSLNVKWKSSEMTD